MAVSSVGVTVGKLLMAAVVDGHAPGRCSAVCQCCGVVCRALFYGREASLHFRGGSSMLADTRAWRVARPDSDSAVLTQSTRCWADISCVPTTRVTTDERKMCLCRVVS